MHNCVLLIYIQDICTRPTVSTYCHLSSYRICYRFTPSSKPTGKAKGIRQISYCHRLELINKRIIVAINFMVVTIVLKVNEQLLYNIHKQMVLGQGNNGDYYECLVMPLWCRLAVLSCSEAIAVQLAMDRWWVDCDEVRCQIQEFLQVLMVSCYLGMFP